MRGLLVALIVLIAALPAAARNENPKAKKARDELGVLLVDLADEARRRGDATAAQAIAETVSFISGVPHPHLDALRRELVVTFEAETPWDFEVIEHWEPIRRHIWTLSQSRSDVDRVDAELIRGLPRAIQVTRLLSGLRVAAGLKALRYDGKRSAKNVVLARKQALPTTAPGEPQRYFMFLTLSATLHQALGDVRFRAALFDPADKGLTVGSCVPDDVLRVQVIGMSGNRRLFPRSPRSVAYPPPGPVAVPLLRLPAKGQTTPQPVPLSVHFFAPLPDLVGAKATLSGAGGIPETCSLAVDDIGAQRVASFLPPRSLHRAGRFTAEITAKDGTSLARWTFTVRVRTP